VSLAELRQFRLLEEPQSLQIFIYCIKFRFQVEEQEIIRNLLSLSDISREICAFSHFCVSFSVSIWSSCRVKNGSHLGLKIKEQSLGSESEVVKYFCLLVSLSPKQ